MDENKINHLIATYEEAGVRILTREGEGIPLPIPSLIEGVLEQGVPSRLKSCLIPLFLSKPELSETVQTMVHRMDQKKALWLKIHYMARCLPATLLENQAENGSGPFTMVARSFLHRNGYS